MKYSSVVLSNDLVQKFPELQALVNFMRVNNAGEVLYQSAIKVGKLGKTVSTTDISAGKDMGSAYKMELDNEYYKLQLNPKSKIDSKTSIFTQLMYFLNILGTNNKAADSAYGAVSFLIKKNLLEVSQRMRTRKGTASYVKSKMVDPGSERFAELIENGIDINNPTLATKALNAIMSGIESSAVKIKFPGSKLVLQSEQYITKDTKVDSSVAPNRLKFVKNKKTYYAEVILPKSLMTPALQAALDRGEDLYLTADFFGYRIPSTELHSAVPLKIVGTYDNLDTNVIIAPFELVYLHGSDFDVDSLFIPMRELYRRTDAAYLGVSPDVPAGYVVNEKGQYVWDGINEQKRIIDLLEKRRQQATKLYERYKDRNTVDAGIYSKELKALEKIASTISESIAKNLIVETMLSTITKPKNRERMNSPIVMANYNAVNLPGSLAHYLDSIDLWDKTTLTDLSHMDQGLAAFKSLQDGLRLTGIFANNIKVLAYLSRAGAENNSPALLSPELSISYKMGDDDTITTFDRISDTDKETGDLTWMYQDGAVNLAIDNLKEQTLSKLNITPLTGNAFSALLGIGFPLKAATLVLLNPELKAILTKSMIQGGDRALRTNLIKAIEELHPAQKLDIQGLIDTYNTPLSKKDLETIAKDPSKASVDVRIGALLIFYKAMTIGDSVKNLSGVLNVIRTFPTNVEDIEKYNRDINSIFTYSELKDISTPAVSGMTVLKDYLKDHKSGNYNFRESFAFIAPNFMSKNPHIAVSLEAYFQAYKIAQENLLLQSENVQGFVRSLEIPLNQFGAKDIRSLQLTEELSKFLISSTVYERLASVSPWLNPRRELFKTNIASFNAKFMEMITALKKKDLLRASEGADQGVRPNRFIQSLVIDHGLGYPRVRMAGGTGMENVDIIDFRADFIELAHYSLTEMGGVVINPDAVLDEETPNEIQQMFIDYIVLSTGFRLSSTSYSLVIPEAMYKNIDAEYVKKLEMLESSPEFRQKVKPLLELSLAIRYGDELQKPTGKPTKDSEDSYSGRDGAIFYDRKYATDPDAKNKENEKSFPKFIKYSFLDEVTERWTSTIYVRISGTDQPFVYYRRVGKKRNDAYFVDLTGFEDPTTMKAWNLYDKFNPEIRDVQIFSMTKSNVRTNLTLPIGEIVNLVAYDDLTRSAAKKAEIVKLIGEDKNGFKTYQVKTIQEQNDNSPLSFAVYDEIDEFLAGVTNTNNNLNCK